MAKVSGKKAKKTKSAKKRRDATEDSAAEKTPVAYDDEEEDLDLAEENIDGEEEADGVDDERKHRQLLEAISGLGGQRKKKLAERSEAAVHMSEFTVTADREGNRIELSDLVGSVDGTPAVPQSTKKQLQHLQQGNKTVECPLSKQDSERIQRDVAFQKTAADVSRWKTVILQNQKAEQLVFPLNQEPSGPKPMERVVSNWKAQTPLEQQIFDLLSTNKQPILDPVLTPMEESSLKAMSLEEAKIRRAELQKARALQSYYEAKASREKKIKSKKYHKVQRKAKRKTFVIEFDRMVKNNPAAALEELKKMELARMQERMSLKHQNSGKWAKSKAIMAKYDEGARKAMQQQLEVNKDLTQKLVTSLDKEEEEEEEVEEAGESELMPDFVNVAEPGHESSNPWMRGKLSEDPVNTEDSSLANPTEEGVEVVEEEDKETEEEMLLRQFDQRRTLHQIQEAETDPVVSVEVEKNEAAAESSSDHEEDELAKFTRLFQGISNGHQNVDAEPTAADSSTQLEEGLLRVRTLEDVELLDQNEEESSAVPAEAATETPLPANQTSGKTRKRKRGIELKQVLTKEATVTQVPLVPTVEDAEDSDGDVTGQRGLIKEAFAGDNVVSDFLKDKRKQEDAGKPKVVDLTLPGWGEWGGTGLKPSRSKRRRFRMKSAPPPPRRDQQLPTVILSEKRNSSVGVHQVSSLPFPFQNHVQFESIIRSPIGRTWNTEQTVQKMTKLKVRTQLGAVIEPMSREALIKEQRSAVGGETSVRKHKPDLTVE